MSKHSHSRSYHRYFENYVEKEVLKPGGGVTIQRVYVGQYYRVDLTDKALRRQQIQFLLLYIVCLAGYLAGALQARVSAVSLVAVSTMLPLIAVVFFGVAIFYRLSVPREMEIRSYRDSSENLIIYSRAFLVCMVICFGFTLGGCLMIEAYSLQETLPTRVCYLLSIGAARVAYRIEKNTPYKKLDPKQARPAESSPIRYEMPD